MVSFENQIDIVANRTGGKPLYKKDVAVLKTQGKGATEYVRDIQRREERGRKSFFFCIDSEKILQENKNHEKE